MASKKETQLIPSTDTTKGEDMSVIIDEMIGQEPYQLRVYVDLRYFPEDQRDYLAKLLAARGIPRDDNSIAPDDPLIKLVSEDPTIASMPEKTPSEKKQKSLAILETLAGHYEKYREQAMTDAVILAMTTENVLTEPPTPYAEEPPLRRRPGLITLPAPTRNLQNPVEYRLKQIYDILEKSPGALGDLQRLTSSMAVEIGRRFQTVDRDGFRGG